jgi:adenylosuccinate lyase
MRKYPDIKDPYEKLKEFTRGKDINQIDYQKFILSIHGLPQDEKDKLLDLKPSNYTGYAQYLAKNVKKF